MVYTVFFHNKIHLEKDLERLCFAQAVSAFQLCVWVGQSRVHDRLYISKYTHRGYVLRLELLKQLGSATEDNSTLCVCDR